MDYKAKARKIANLFVRKSVFDMTDDELASERTQAKKEALKCVNEIEDAVCCTTNHCTLNKIDASEVQKDLDYWNKVRDEISRL